MTSRGTGVGASVEEVLMIVACLFLLVATPVIFLAIKGIFVILMEGPAAEGQAITPKDSNLENSAIYSPNSTAFSVLGDWFISDDVRLWAVDPGAFLNDAEDDAYAATMLGNADQFDLGHEGSGDDPSQSADLASD